MRFIEYKKNVSTILLGHDTLGRRLLPATRHIRTLSLSPDGRIAFGISSKLIVLNLSLVLQASRVWKGVPKQASALDIALSDSSQRLNQNLRTSVVGLEVVFVTDENDPDVRKERDNMLQDIIGVTWTQRLPIFVVTGSGTCFAVRPRLKSTKIANEGTWDSLLDSWERTSFGHFGSNELDRLKPRANGNSKSQKTKAEDKMTLDDDNNETMKSDTNNVDPNLEVKVSCIGCVYIFKEGSIRLPNSEEYEGFIVCGEDRGLKFYQQSEWYDFAKPKDHKLFIPCGYVNEFRVIDGIRRADKRISIMVVSCDLGNIEVYALWLDENEENEYIPKVEQIWHPEEMMIPGAISYMSWNIHEGCLSLALAIGNGISIIKWSGEQNGTLYIYNWDDPVTHIVENAHDQMVTSVEVLADSSFISSSLDGKIIHWEQTNDYYSIMNQNEDILLDCTIIHDDKNKREPVMSMVATMNGFGIVAATTTIQSSGEVHDFGDSVLAKFSASGRKSILSLYSMPWLGEPMHVASTIVRRLSRYIEEDRCRKSPIGIWDIEHYIEQQHDEDDIIAKELGRYVDGMIAILAKKEEDLIAHYQRCRITVAILRIILNREKDKDVEWIKQLSSEYYNLRNSLVCEQFDNSMKSFLQNNIDMNKTNLQERQSLEHMCQFVMICNDKYVINKDDMKERVKRIRTKLSSNSSCNEELTIMCPICSTIGEKRSLILNTKEDCIFYCSDGERFVHCIQTGLACSDVMPLFCCNCDARSIKLDIYTNSDLQPSFQWLHNANICCLCHSPLLTAHGYPI